MLLEASERPVAVRPAPTAHRARRTLGSLQVATANLAPSDVLRLQQQAGNRAVVHALAVQRANGKEKTTTKTTTTTRPARKRKRSRSDTESKQPPKKKRSSAKATGKRKRSTTGTASDEPPKKKSKVRDFAALVADALVARPPANAGQHWVRYGANQSLALFKVGPGATALTDTGRIAEIHSGTHNVRFPKSYDALRVRQGLRWVSTTATAYLKKMGNDPREVQAVLHGGKIHISTNMAGSNRILAATVKNHPGKVLTHMASALGDAELSKREKRHLTKLRRDIVADKAAKSDRYKDLRAAAKEFSVVTGGADGLHAERRLKAALNVTITPEMIGGVKRPCARCFLELFESQVGDQGPGFGVTPAPFWPSKASNIGVPEYAAGTAADVDEEEAKRLAEQVARKLDRLSDTYVTKAGESVTHAYDTDSDSEAEEDAMDVDEDEAEVVVGSSDS